MRRFISLLILVVAAGPVVLAQPHPDTAPALRPAAPPATASAPTEFIARGNGWLVHRLLQHVVYTTVSTGEMKLLTRLGVDSRLDTALADRERLYILQHDLVPAGMPAVGQPDSWRLGPYCVSVFMLDSGRRLGTWQVGPVSAEVFSTKFGSAERDAAPPPEPLRLIPNGFAYGKHEFFFDGPTLVRSPSTRPATLPTTP